MDELRHDDYDAEPPYVEHDVPDAPIDADVLGRLAAYGGTPEPETAYEPEARVTPQPEMSLGPDVVPQPEDRPAPAFPAEPELASDPILEPELEPEPVAEGELLEELVVEEAPPANRRFGRRGGRASKPRKDEAHGDKRARKLVGLKIGASQIAAAQLVNDGTPELVHVFREPLEPGVVVSGEIRDPDTLGDALKRFFELHKLPKRGVRLGLSNNRIGVRVFDIDGVADEQLENAIRFRAEEVLPIPLDQAVLDYVVLGEEVHPDGTRSKRILLVVAYRDVVDRYLQACRRAGLQVVGIDLEAFALLRSLEPPAERDAGDGALVAVAIGHDRTTIAVSNGVHCEFARVLDWGGWSLNVAVARELDRAPSEVESIKRQLSFARETSVEGLTAEQVQKTRSGIQRALASFARELVSSLQFYQAQPGALGIGEIVLTGGATHMDGLAEALGEIVGVPIRQGDPFKRLNVGSNVVLDDQTASLAVAIGLGIED